MQDPCKTYARLLYQNALGDRRLSANARALKKALKAGGIDILWRSFCGDPVAILKKAAGRITVAIGNARDADSADPDSPWFIIKCCFNAALVAVLANSTLDEITKSLANS
ncbi:MAG: hypothetical protein SNJ81_05210 [Cyanobacteriota bacterium]